MKKVLALFIVTLLVLTLAACGGNSAPAGQANEAGNTQTADNADTQAAENAQAESAEEDGADKEAADDDTLNPADITDWKEYVKEYEARVDEFIEVYKQYKAAPLNAAIAEKYEKYAKKVDEWANEAQELIKKLTMEEIVEFAAEIERIAKKTEESIDE